jgi:hypothetical protein
MISEMRVELLPCYNMKVHLHCKVRESILCPAVALSACSLFNS